MPVLAQHIALSVWRSHQAKFSIGIEGDFGRHHVTPKSLNAMLVNKLVCIDGIVTKCSLVRSAHTQKLAAHQRISTENFAAGRKFSSRCIIAKRRSRYQPRSIVMHHLSEACQLGVPISQGSAIFCNVFTHPSLSNIVPERDTQPLASRCDCWLRTQQLASRCMSFPASSTLDDSIWWQG